MTRSPISLRADNGRQAARGTDMTSTDQIFSSIAVIGAGTMGSGIAAQIANAGHDVLLLDLPARADGEKSPAEQAIDRLLTSDPPQLMHKRNAGRIIAGSINDDFARLASCDWIIEAVVERLDIKKDLYARLDATIGPDCIVSSNTSTERIFSIGAPIHPLCAKPSGRFRRPVPLRTRRPPLGQLPIQMRMLFSMRVALGCER